MITISDDQATEIKKTFAVIDLFWGLGDEEGVESFFDALKQQLTDIGILEDGEDK